MNASAETDGRPCRKMSQKTRVLSMMWAATLLVLVLFALFGCDSAPGPTDMEPPYLPAWLGDWSGEMYNDLDLDNVNGPRGRVDSLFVSFTRAGDGFEANGVWTLKNAQTDSMGIPFHGHVTFQGEDKLGVKYFHFLFNIGDGGDAQGGWKHFCQTEYVDAPPGDLTCFRIRSTLDAAFSPTPPPFAIYYLSPVQTRQ